MGRTLLGFFGAALLFVAFLSAASSAGEPLLAGVAAADITPEPGRRMWGYSNRLDGATGALDPLWAKAVVFRAGERSAALVALDLGRTPEEPLLAELARRCQAKCGVGQLFVTASHTHQAPTLETYRGEKNDYPAAVVDAIERIVAEAAARLEPVRIGVAHAEVDLAHNRRRRLADGRIAMQWRNAEREPTAPVDRRVAVVRLDRADGSPLAVLFHYACHPVVLGADNLQYSADFVGAARKTIEDDLGAPALFLQGACGDINPYLDKTPLAEGGIDAMRAVGRELGGAVAAAARSAKTTAASSLDVDIRRVPIRVRWDTRDPETSGLLSRVYGRRYDDYLAPLLAAGQFEATLSTLVIADRVALVGMPGEMFVEFQADLARRAPAADTLLVGYTNGYHAYFPTIRDAAAGGYGGKVATYAAPGAGELLVNEALIALNELRGDLTARPQPEDFELIEWDEEKAKQ